MGKGRPRAVEKSVLGQTSIVSSPGALSLPQAPVFYPTEEEFRDPLEFIDKIRAEAEPFGVCKIVPPKSWKPPFALDVDEFTFPTKTQAIHQLQVRFAACNTETFELEYNRFLEDHCGKKVGKRVRVLFEGDDLDLCKLFNAVKRFGGYDKVVKEKKWGEVFRFLRSVGKSGPITECSKHVLSQLYREHLFDFESYNSRLNCDQSAKKSKRGSRGSEDTDVLSSKKRWNGGEKVNVDKLQEKEEFDQICEQCKSGLHGEVMLLCDKCNKGWHIYCLSPPLKQIPSGNWYCLECVNSEKDSFGFVPGKHFSIETFRRLADKAKRKWFGSSTCAVSRPQIEKLFWEIVEGSVGEVEVMYGSDLDTSLYGSGFPRVSDPRPSSIEVESWNEYCASPWNLNNLPKLQGSMLRTVHDNIEGVMVPWLYMGMLFSSFCWHFEDHCFYSMNYLHWGEPKCWYSVPGSEAHVFEQAMKSSLPDLFDAQPDLLFQLVTMLNPSVLQDNGVPVYTVLQEPGNFVITFPRSYHGGFNLGLNCAEAVNFAPADWLPHGGFGAELYRLYHKPAVLSHEELLCVVAKNECNEKVTPYLRKELIKLFAKEKDWRERLWRNGIVRSSPMSPRKYPEYVGTEEDPTCIICQQYLYLSAVACNCSPSAFVCLEHWEHLCECKSKKQRLLYRHTLAELNSLVLTVDACNLEETAQGRSCRRQYSCSKDTNAATKKVKGGRATHAQLAEEWILSSFNIFLNEFSDAAYVDALKEAEQFLWAGSEMDPVRDMAKNLIEAKKWALNVRSCLSKIETWLLSCDNNTEKVNLGDLESLLNVEPLPCNEPGHVKLKVCADEARRVANEITTALSTFSYVSMDVFEELYSRASGLPTYVQECKKLGSQIALEKAWLVSARNCISANSCTAVDIDILHTLKLEISELQVQVPEMKMLSDLLQNAESWQVRCREMLGSTIKLKELVVILEDAYDFTVSFPELKLLRQYHCDAVTWTFRFHDILLNIEEREDQHNVVMELTCILKDGASLRVQVDELPLVEVELRKACCRDKALKARATPMPLDYIKQLISDAARLCIENEKLFIGTSAILATAISWEERAQQVLAAEAKISDFENVLRVSEHIVMALPSLDDLKNTLSMAKSWIVKCQPFLESVLSSESASRSLLRVDALKVLLAEAKLLKVTLEEPEMLQSILKVCEAWQGDACALLDRADSLLAANDISWDLIEDISTKVEELFTAIKCSTKVGLSLGFDFCEISKLQKASCRLFWCSKSLSFCSSVPVLEEVEDLIKEAEHMSVASNLERLLIDGISWLKNALEVFSERLVRKRCKLAGVEEILVDAQKFKVPFLMMIDRVENAIGKHMSWREQVYAFFNSATKEKTWSALLQLKNLGSEDAFDSPELDMVISEVERVENWITCCRDIVKAFVTEMNPLSVALAKINYTLDRSLQIYQGSIDYKLRDLCVCCSIVFEDEELVVCLKCGDRYHRQCSKSTFANANAAKKCICTYCHYLESGAISRNGCLNMISKGKHPELGMLVQLLSSAKNFCVRSEELDMVQKIVERSLACKAFLTEIVEYSLAYQDKDLSPVSDRLLIALKAVALAGVYDQNSSSLLENALAKYSWKIRVKKVLEGSQKPLMQQIQRILKEGLALKIPSADHFIQKLQEVQGVGLRWADNAKKVASDAGELGLDEVFKLINEGENLSVHLEKELKLLRARSELYCICRKPYDQRAMIACDLCNEWYHFDCINLCGPTPKTYHCPACKTLTGDSLSSPTVNHEERSSSTSDVGPHTPPPQNTRKRKPRKSRSKKPLTDPDLTNKLRDSCGIDQLWWRIRKPLRRTSRKRVEFESLSPFFHSQ